MDRLLSSHGHEVVAVESGEAALEILKRDHRIRLVITDSRIGGMTATDLFKANARIERISDDGESCPPEFILLTHLRPDNELNGRGEQVLQEAAALGFVDVLFKPLVRDELLHHVRQIDCSEPRNPLPASQPKSQKNNAAAAAPGLAQQLQQLDEKYTALEKNFDELRSIQGVANDELSRAKKWMRIFISDE